MMACTQHVSFQLPNEFTPVGYLLDGIENVNPALQAAIARVLDDTGAGGKRSKFELCAPYILPKDPVVKRCTSADKRHSAEISLTATGEYAGSCGGGSSSRSSSSSDVRFKGTGKKGIGSSGVHLRYHKPEEYNRLTHDQRKELQEWRSKKSGGAGNKKVRRDA
jgi:hypothetical protein